MADAGDPYDSPFGRGLNQPTPVPPDQQLFHAWGNVSRQLGVILPRSVNRTIYYRARLDDAVKPPA